MSEKKEANHSSWFVGLQSPDPVPSKPHFSSYRSNRFSSPNIASFKKGRHGWTPVMTTKPSTPTNQRTNIGIPKTKIDLDSSEDLNGTDIESPRSSFSHLDLHTQNFPEGVNWSPIRSPSSKCYDSDQTRLDSKDFSNVVSSPDDDDSMSRDVIGLSTVKKIEKRRATNKRQSVSQKEAIKVLTYGNDSEETDQLISSSPMPMLEGTPVEFDVVADGLKKPPETGRRLSSPSLSLSSQEISPSSPYNPQSVCNDSYEADENDDNDWAHNIALSPSQANALSPCDKQLREHHSRIQQLSPLSLHKCNQEQPRQSEKQANLKITKKNNKHPNTTDRLSRGGWFESEEENVICSARSEDNGESPKSTQKKTSDLKMARDWVKSREELQRDISLSRGVSGGGILLHQDDWEFASEILRQRLDYDPLLSPGGFHASSKTPEHLKFTSKQKMKTLIVGSRSTLAKWSELLGQENHRLKVFDMSMRRLQPRMKTILDHDVVLCTLDTLCKFKSTDPWGEMSACESSSSSSSSNVSPPWNRKPSKSKKGATEHVGKISVNSEERRIELEEHVSCHCILHRILWGRLIVDDAHLILRLPKTFPTWSGETSIRSLCEDSSGVSTGSATSIAKSEALSLLRADKRWLIIAADKAPKLWIDRKQLRKIADVAGAPSKVSLIQIVPELLLELG